MKKVLLITILVLASILRFYRLDSYPALNADEAAIGYNAYSLIETGIDEHANSWPIHFQSFNDFKPGLYFYIVLPFVKFIGLNEWSVRIPGALLGVLTVLTLYLLVKELEDSLKIENCKLKIIASFLLAISPWHIHFSRGGWEVNAATFFITTGLWLFLKFINSPKNRQLYLSASGGFFALSLYTYHATRLVVPLLGFGLVLIYYKNVLKHWRHFALALIISGVILLPLGFDLASPGAMSRAVGVGLFADPGPLARINEQRGEHVDFQGVFPRLFHNKAVNYGLAFFENWGEHFWGEFLFLSGDEIQRNRVPETGQLYLFEIITLVVGFIMIAKSRNSYRWLPVMLWLLLAPVAAALTFQSPHALRTHNMVIPLTIISSFGFLMILESLKSNKKYFISGCIVIGVLIAWNFARYLHMYYVHMAKEYPYSSQYGVKELVSYIQGNSDKYDKIIVTDRYDQPYILFLFYSQYPPEKFQKEHELTPRDKYGFSTVRNFDNFEFRSIKFDEDRPVNPNSLIIGTDEEIPDEANIIKEIYGINGYKYFEVVAN